MVLALGLIDAIAAGLEHATQLAGRRLGDAAWVVLHGLGVHRWRDGYLIDLERGWRQYRGSRCVVCDVPWEGW
jgi:hypothetical protein